MRKSKWFLELKKIVTIFAGCMLLAVAFNMIYDPCEIVTGGVSGLGIVIKSLTKSIYPGGIPLWVSTLALNIPIYLAGLLIRGKKFVLNTLLGTLLLSLALYLVPTVDIVQGDKMLACIFGAVIGGTGAALVLMTMSSTGGTDMLGVALSKFYHGRNVSEIIGLLDGIVVLIGAMVFGLYSTMYAILSVFIYSKVCDLVLTGQRDGKMFYIISKENEAIAQEILELERGVTKMSVQGVYTGDSLSMLMCVVYRKEIVPIKKVIRKHDPRAFVIISDVRDVRGEGFIEDILDSQ